MNTWNRKWKKNNKENQQKKKLILLKYQQNLLLARMTTEQRFQLLKSGMKEGTLLPNLQKEMGL